MKTWHSGLVAELKARIDKKFRLFYFGFTTPLCYTDCTTPLAYNGRLYNPRPISADDIVTSMNTPVDRVSISIDMSDRDAILLNTFVGQDPTDTEVYVYLQALDRYAKEIATATLFSGKIDSYNYSDNKLSIVIASFFVLWNKRRMETSSPSCRRNFKELGCNYAGAESWCDRSYTRCLTLGNTVQFNGFRFLPDLIGRDIWWGKIQGKEYTVEVKIKK